MTGKIAIIVLAASSGCFKSVVYQCVNDSECVQGGIQGTCETQDICSFPDPNCESGRRFGELAGSLSNQCVVGPPDAGIVPIDARIDMFVPDARECFGAGTYELCFTGMPPMGTVSLSGTLDTSTDTRCVAPPAPWMSLGQPDACMIVARDLSVTAALTVAGSRPLVLVGENVTISA